MKTSNKLIIAGLLLLLIAVIVYDYQIKAAYDSRSYKNPYLEFTTLKFRDFDTVDVISSTAANVKFVQGPFKVSVDSNTLEFVRIKQKGSRLQVTANFEHDYQYNPNPYILVISCPKLSEANISATYTANGKPVIDTVVKEEWNMRRVLIDGFKEDNLSVRQDYASTVILSNDIIGSLQVTTGESVGSGSKLIIQKSNHFHKAAIDILNKSNFYLNDAFIEDLHYHLADSARMIINGAAQKLIENNIKTIK